ncbi:MAG: periplasmic heavy metal sensor [Candidatus Omnitrophica bacterium]|nr:periplasmic heavy metal sensor [Candidatus Omnitrophota bacterium]
MNIKNTTYVAAVTLLISWASLANAQPWEKDSSEGKAFRERMEKRIAEVHKELGLNSDQEKKLEARRKEHREKMKVLYENIKVKKKDLGEELQKAEMDENRVRTIHEELKELKAEKEDYRLEGILEVREILTPEQFSKFMQIKEEHKAKRREKFRGFMENK